MSGLPRSLTGAAEVGSGEDSARTTAYPPSRSRPSDSIVPSPPVSPATRRPRPTHDQQSRARPLPPQRTSSSPSSPTARTGLAALHCRQQRQRGNREIRRRQERTATSAALGMGAVYSVLHSTSGAERRVLASPSSLTCAVVGCPVLCSARRAHVQLATQCPYPLHHHSSPATAPNTRGSPGKGEKREGRKQGQERGGEGAEREGGEAAQRPSEGRREERAKGATVGGGGGSSRDGGCAAGVVV